MKFLIPTQKDAFRLVNDLHVPQGVVVGIGQGVFDVPAGTVIAIDSMRWNKLFKLDSSVRLRILVSPDQRLSLKKYGGTASGGVGFSLTAGALRELDVELVENMK